MRKYLTALSMNNYFQLKYQTNHSETWQNFQGT